MLEFLKFRSDKAGLPPGSSVYVGKDRSHAVQLRLIDYGSQTLVDSTEMDWLKIKELIAGPSTSWLNVDGLHEVAIIEQVGALLDLHALTIEDILNTTQRPKIDIFDNYVYLVVKMPFYDGDRNIVEMEQVSFILTEHFLVSFQEVQGDVFAGVRQRITTNKGRIRKMGCGYLLYALLDALVDGYFQVLEQLGEYVEALEEQLVSEPSPDTLSTT